MKPSHLTKNNVPIKRIRLEFIVTTDHIEFAIYEIMDWNSFDVDVKKVNKKNVVDHIKNTFYSFGDNFPESFADFKRSNELMYLAKELFPEFYKKYV